MGQYLKITIPCNSELLEILIAELGNIQYDSFQEIDGAIEAFVNEDIYEEKLLISILKKYNISSNFKIEELENINWNEEWEKNFDPVFVDEKVQIRATFHEPKSGYDYDVIINPKMSFGTGHHETTHLMVAEQLKINHENKSILDVGTGTGILAIMAYKLGSGSISATDIDDWCIENSRENFEINQVRDYEVYQGMIDKLTLTGLYDIIYANINKNVLMNELPVYKSLLNNKGILVLSGFYTEDIDDLVKKAQNSGLTYEYSKTKNNWVLLRFSLTKI